MAPPLVAPSPEPAASQSPSPSTPANPNPPQIPMPNVALVQRSFAFGALPAGAAATAEDAAALTPQAVEGWMINFGEVLTRYQGLAAADGQKQIELTSAFDSMVAAGPFAEVLKTWALRDASETRKFTVSDAKLLKLYGKPWGRAAYADIGFKLIETGGPHDSTRDLRIRSTVGRVWRVIDAWDSNTGRWLVGEAPRYSTLVLENEAQIAVSNYLYNETYVAGGPEQFAQRAALSPFLQARFDALNELNSAFKEHRIVDRHFEGTTVQILGFDPATYLGDGILTVLVSGRLVETSGSGTTREVPFSQQMKFLRSLRGGSPNLNAVDQQSMDGTWDSGGDLALYAVDIEFG
jgi:hypothetical protein